MVSTISACSSKRNEKSHVLVAMDKDIRLASNPIRLSFDESNTLLEAQEFIKVLKELLAITK